MSDLTTLKRKRGGVKHSLTSFNTYLDSINAQDKQTESALIELKNRLNQALNLLDKFNNIQDEIEILCEEESLAEQYKEKEGFVNKYYAAISRAQLLLKKPDDSSSDGQSNYKTATIKLPEISLPKFNGNFADWLEFRDIFISVIHENEALTDIQKFFYLRGALEGSASAVIKRIQYNAANYSVAWKALRDRYNDTKKLLHDHVSGLLYFEPMQRVSHDKLQQLADNISSHLGAITQLGQSTENWDYLLIFLISQKIDTATLSDWERQTRTNAKLSTIDEFTAFLRERAGLLARLDYTCNQHNKSGTRDSTKFNKRETSKVFLSNSSQYVCGFCKGEHSIYYCEKFLKLTVPERNQYIKKNPSICVNCLREGHAIFKCQIGSCKKCKGRHNTLLHLDKVNNEQDAATSTCAMSSGVPTSQVILSTACIYIRDQQNNYQQIRALLDCGSQTSFISEDAIKRLGLNTSNADLTVLGISNIGSHINKICQIYIKSMHSDFNVNLKCYVLPVISNTLPSSTITLNHSLPKDMKLADSNFNVPGPIEMLIGADLFWSILNPERIALGKNLPILQSTKFGWIVSGQVGVSQTKSISCNLSIGQELLRALERFWEIEEVSDKRLLSKDERECERIFSESTSRMTDGRFVVNMPLKQAPQNLGESRSQAENRFYALERRLSKNETLRNQYKDFMTEYRNLGHMSVISENSSKQMQYYMPHHGVLKSSSLTTKLRVVFDASAPTSNGLSLNNIQLVGPVLQDDLLSIILRFRQYNYVISADIAKMYRQVLINPEQRSLQRILWRESPNELLNTYELNTVTYGQASASFLSIRCLFDLANEIRESKPNISRIIEHDFYVDDMLTGSDSLLEAQEICRDVSEVLQKGCFDLRKWCSNQPEVLSNIHHSNLAYDILEFSTNDKTQTLGLVWSCQNDKLFYNVDNSSFGSKVTKRSILSATAKIFDPLGLVSPCTIIPKVLMQKLWSERISWDEPLPEHLSTMWVDFENQIAELNNLSINRHALIKNSKEVELHGFADSSERSYGACVHLRSLDASKCIQVSLLCAKSKVAPIKTISIPRLELCAALLLARLVNKVVSSLRIKFKNVTLWSDSTIVLSWMKTSPNLLKTFTGNRVSEIQTLTENYQWRYISTHENPADIVSRGLYPIHLLKSELWWNGPTWLNLDRQNWPNESPIVDNLPDLKSQTCLATNSNNLDFPFERFSNFSRMINTFAYILRFKNNCLNKNDTLKGVLSHLEINKATKALIKICQYQSFSNEIDDLSKPKGTISNNKLVGLTPFLDEDKILRVGGRLKYSDYEFNKKHPILLPSKHPFTKLLFRYEHERLLHAGPQMLLSTIRETYWPLSGRNLARSTTRKCMRCFRYNPRSTQPIMGNLPASRVLPSSPFSVVGVDYAGPFLVKDRKGRGCKLSKCYIALFICFATKALHIELVSSLSTESFLQALRRFISRRGKPSKIFSDNGTNFVGAQRELYKILNDKSLEAAILSFTTPESIEWHFIPPYSPHFGGLWESGVKSCKHHLKRVLSDTPLLFEELYTLCAQVEAILNSRPLSPLTSDPNDLHPLTPAHFLIGRSMLAAPEHNIQDLAMNRLNRYQFVQQMYQHFWHRWKLEYISEMQTRVRWKYSKGELIKDMLVLIKDDLTKPTQWSLGRVVFLHPGDDGVSRVATVKTASGLIKRSFKRLCPLPIEH